MSIQWMFNTNARDCVAGKITDDDMAWAHEIAKDLGVVNQ